MLETSRPSFSRRAERSLQRGGSCAPGESPTLAELIREDWITHQRRWLHPGLHAVVVHRLGRASASLTSWRGRAQWSVFRIARVLVVNLYGIEIPPEAVIGRRLRLPHAHGIVIVPGAVLGDDCMLRHNVTLGLASSDAAGRPTLGNRVEVGPGASIVGGISVGDDTLIGPHALVIGDVPANSRVISPVATVRPAKAA